MDSIIECLKKELKDGLVQYGFLKRIKDRGKQRFWVEVKPEHLRKTLEKLRKEYSGHLIEVAATDLGEEVEVLYYIDVPRANVYLIKAKVPSRRAEVESMAGIYGSAAWYEREAYDHVGVIFKEHPGLERIILPDSAPLGFHPFRRRKFI